MMNFSGAFNARHGVTFEQEPQNHFGFLDGQLHAVERLITGISENLAVLGALVSLAVLVFTEFAAFGLAVVAGHCEIYP